MIIDSNYFFLLLYRENGVKKKRKKEREMGNYNTIKITIFFMLSKQVLYDTKVKFHPQDYLAQCQDV